MKQPNIFKSKFQNVPRAIRIFVDGVPMTSISLHQGETHQLTATVRNRSGQLLNVTVAWHTDNTAIASIVQTGPEVATVTAGATPGTANIFASVGGVASPILQVTNLGVATPTPVATAYSVTPSTFSPAAGTVVPIVIQLLDQFSHAFNQAGKNISINLSGSGGTLSATSGTTDSTGKVNITLTVGSGQTYVVSVADGAGLVGTSGSIVSGVLQPVPPPPPPPPPPIDTTPAAITLTNGNFTLNRAETQPIVAVVTNAEDAVLATPTLVYHSSNPAAVTINSATGVVTGVGAGTSVITATLASPSLTSNALTVTCTGLPDNTPNSVAIISSPFSGNQGATTTLFAQVKNVEGVVINQSVAWASDNGAVASINPNTGVVTIGATIGTANITAVVGALTSSPVVVTGQGPVIISPPPPPPPDTQAPQFRSGIDTPILNVDFASYTTHDLFPSCIAPGTGHFYDQHIGQCGIGSTPDPGVFILTDAGETWVRIQYNGSGGESHGIICPLPQSGSKLVCTQFDFRLTPRVPMTLPWDIKFFMQWHGDPGAETRNEICTHFNHSNCPDIVASQPKAVFGFEVVDQIETTCGSFQPIGPFGSDVADGNKHTMVVTFKPNSAPGARDGQTLVWIDDINIIRTISSAVGVVPVGGFKTWCNNEDIDNIISNPSFGIDLIQFGGPLSTDPGNVVDFDVANVSQFYIN